MEGGQETQKRLIQPHARSIALPARKQDLVVAKFHCIVFIVLSCTYQLTFFWCPTWHFSWKIMVVQSSPISACQFLTLDYATVEFPSLQLNVKPVEKYSRARRVMLMPKVEWQCWLWQFPLSNIDKKPTLLWWWWLFPRVRGLRECSTIYSPPAFF